MTKVHIKDKFNTSFGLVFVVQDDKTFRVGDIIETDNGDHYSIKEFRFPSRPTDEDVVGLVVEKVK